MSAPPLWFVTTSEPVYTPWLKPVAAGLKPTDNCVAEPPASVPLVEETVNQDKLVAIDQLMVDGPELESIRFCVAGLNGPPIGPLEGNPPPGTSESALAAPERAAISPCPAGLPQPVQRS